MESVYETTIFDKKKVVKEWINAMQALMSYAHWEFFLIFLSNTRFSVLGVKKAENFNQHMIKNFVK